MALENATWGAPRIHREFLKLGHVVSERTVSRYLARIRPEPTRPRSQTWATFLKNHARDIVAADMFVVPTIRFQVLYIFIILGLERRRLIFANVTANPTADWLAQQIVNAFPWDTEPRFLIRDRDRAYGLAFSARVRGLGIREIRTAVGAPQMNAFAERVIGTLRRECFDHLIVLSERHAQRLLAEFRDWYNQDRLHLALGKDAPDHRPMSRPSSATLSPFPVSAVSTIVGSSSTWPLASGLHASVTMPWSACSRRSPCCCRRGCSSIWLTAGPPGLGRAQTRSRGQKGHGSS
jgi:transposase InsO family protein